MAQTVKNLPVMQETWLWSLGQEDPLEKGMATYSSILAWKIPWTEEGGYRPWGRQQSNTTEHAHTHSLMAVTLLFFRAAASSWVKSIFPAHFLVGAFVFLFLSLIMSAYSRYQFFVGHVLCRHLPVHSRPSCLLNRSICRVKVFNFDEVWFIPLSFCGS